MAYLPLVLSAAGTIAGTVTSAIGAQKEGEAVNAAYEANANLANLQAEGIERSRAYDEERLRREKGRMISAQRAAYAKSGVLISEGSPLEVQLDTALEYERDIEALKYNTNIKKSQSLYQGQMYRMYGESALRASRAKSTGILLSGFGQAANTAFALKQG